MKTLIQTLMKLGALFLTYFFAWHLWGSYGFGFSFGLILSIWFRISDCESRIE
jgi:hypothetical protein